MIRSNLGPKFSSIGNWICHPEKLTYYLIKDGLFNEDQKAQIWVISYFLGPTFMSGIILSNLHILNRKDKVRVCVCV